MKQAFLLLLMTLTLSMGIYAQEVSGNVTDVGGEPLIGATILEKGTSNGTITDFDGNFSIKTSSASPVLIISYTGYQVQEIATAGQTTFAVVLEEGLQLDEVVVTGYTVDSRRSSTGAVSTVKSKDLTAVPSGNVEQQLQGRVSGLTVITNGQPGTTSIIRVRGFGAFGGNEPLYVVDGVPVSSIDFLAPNDIESTTVLKDAASASIYGARAANGVIVYTTKRGTKGQGRMNVTYDGLVGVTNPGNGPEFLNPQEFADWTWTAIRNTAAANGEDPVFNHPQFGTGSTPVIPDYLLVGSARGVTGNVNLAEEATRYNNDSRKGALYLVMPANKEGTDWYDAITRNAAMMRHNLGISGAGDRSRYYVSMGVQQQEGILIHNDFNRYHFRANSEFDVTDFLRVGQNLQFTYLSVLGLTGGSGGIGSASEENDILGAFRMPTIIPVYDSFGGYAGTAAGGFNNPRNPVGQRDRVKDNRNYGTFSFGNVYAELDLLKNLTFRSSLGGRYFNNFYSNYTYPTYEHSENQFNFAYQEGYFYNLSWVNTNTLHFTQNVGIHGFDVLAGVEALNTGKGRSMVGSGQNPFSRDLDFVTLNTANNARQVSSDLNLGVTFYSLFGRLNYSYNNKYYLTGVLRRDGSSRFGEANRYGVFPAVSAAWRVTGEDFLSDNTWLNDLKVRGGWGQMGNSNNVSPTNQYTLYSDALGGGSYPITGSNTSASSGFFQSTIGNPNAKWETSTTTNVGVEATLLNGKLEVIMDLWKKETEDLLYQVPLPAVAGAATRPSVNIASMLNSGFDFQVINRGKIKGDLKYELSLTGSFLKNEITKLADGLDFFETSGNSSRLSTPVIRNQVGESISSFFGYQVVGLFQNQAEVDAAPDQPGAGVGRFRYADLNSFDEDGEVLLGVPDGVIDAADRTVIGHAVPDFTGGLYFSLNYKNVGLDAYFYTSIGNEIFNQSKWFSDFYASFTGASLSARIKDSWSPTNTDTDIPIAENVSNFSTNTQANSYYVEDGSYLRMQNLSIHYDLPGRMTKGALKNLRLYASVNNLFTLTKYQGLDPAVGGAVDTSLGIDIGNYPVTRSVLVGVTAGF